MSAEQPSVWSEERTLLAHSFQGTGSAPLLCADRSPFTSAHCYRFMATRSLLSAKKLSLGLRAAIDGRGGLLQKMRAKGRAADRADVYVQIYCPVEE
ncbi:hypothetical protein EYF80_004674 [Liparis tanakae]|uniref:Uncharacterized protein n=1 Tax=Liparis tanakae TaxID=230148 RepID=A0A4Z2J4B2_9TELE|nr:hypothetical protein EYF80_004674 [Liparis tanakae]